MNKMYGVSLLSLMFVLAGCDNSDNSNPQIIGNFYKTIEECRHDFSNDICVKSHDSALLDTIQTADKFDNITDCMEKYGQDGCSNTQYPEITTEDQHPGDRFIPTFQGFSVIVDYLPEEDDDSDETGNTYPVYGYTGYVYQPNFVYIGGYHPFVVSSGFGYSKKTTTSIFTTRINNKVVASTGTRVNSTFVRPNVSSVKASISRSGFGTRSFSASRSAVSVSRGGFGGKAGGFGGGRGG